MKILYWFYFDAFLVCFATTGCKDVDIIASTPSKKNSKSDDSRIIGGEKATRGEFKGTVSGSFLYILLGNCVINRSNSTIDLDTIVCMEGTHLRWHTH